MAGARIAGAAVLLLFASEAAAIRPIFSWDLLGNMTFIHTCNESGLFNTEALDTIAKFQLVTIEKGQGFNDGTGRLAEQKIVEQLAAVKKRNPLISTVFYMNSVLDWYFYEMHSEYLAHPAWWLHDSWTGKPVRSGGDSRFDPPKGGMLVFDHGKSEVRAWWEGVCAKAVASGVVDGCFSDSSQPGSHGTGKHLNASDNSLFEKGKVETMSAITAKFGGTAGKPYKGSTGVLIGKKPDQQGINAFQIEFFGPSESSIQELQAGVKQGYLVEAHTHVVDDAGCKSPKMESVVAAFLIGAGDDCYFGSGLWISNRTLDVTQRWCPPFFERPLGRPLADAVKDEAGLYTRSFASGTKVYFDTRTNMGQVWWHGDPTPPMPPPAPVPPAPAPPMRCGTCGSSVLVDHTFANDDIATNVTADAQMCCTLCAAAAACMQWSWHPHEIGKWPPNMCHLHGASAVMKHKRSITSGIMNHTRGLALKADDSAISAAASPPPMKLMNNTRLAIDDAASLPNFVTSTPQICLDHCVKQPYCGGIVWQSPSEPVPLYGCKGRLPSEGCCYPAPIYKDYKPITSTLRAPQGGLGFVSAIVRYSLPNNTLLNNTRLNYPASYLPPTFVCDSAERCLSVCVNDSSCGGMVWMAPYEPTPVPRPGCAKQRKGIDGCCYPAPIFDHYQVIPPGQPLTYGFISAIVRTNASKPWPAPPPPAPAPPQPYRPSWVPASWRQSWAMNRSIAVYWRNSTGVEPAEFYDGMGMALFDWAHGSEQWANPEDGGPSDNGAVLARQCEVIKKRQGKDFRCIVYRNTVIALNQFRHVSQILDNPLYSGYFLKFKKGATQATKVDGRPDCWGIADPRAHGCKDSSCANCDVLGRRPSCNEPIWPTPVVCAISKPSDVHVPLCDKADPTKCSKELYFDQNQCAQVPGDNWSNDTKDVYQGLICKGKSCNCGKYPCGEFLFDFRNSSLVDWYLKTHMGGPTALGHPDVDGLILDDFWSSKPSEIDSHSIEDMGLSAAEASAVHAAYGGALSKLLAYIDAQNKSLPGGRPMAYGGDMMSSHSTASCNTKLGYMCGTTQSTPVHGEWYAVQYREIDPPAYGVKAVNSELDVAYFLLTRAPFAWIAGGQMLGWKSSHWFAANKSRRINFRHDLRPPEFNGDYGKPTDNCTQTAPGVYVRHWTKATVTVDCNTVTGKIQSH